MKPPSGTLIKPGHLDAANLIAVYPCNAGTGPFIYDYAPTKDWDSRNHGTINGATWVLGKFGPTLSYNGTSNYTRVPDFLVTGDNGKQASFFCWIKCSTPDADTEFIFSQWSSDNSQRSWGITTGSTSVFGRGRPRVFISSSGISGVSWDSSIDVCDSTLHFFGFTFNGNKSAGNRVTIYVDGLPDTGASGTDVASLHNSTEDIVIGARLNNGVFSDYVTALIDIPMIYNREVQPDEVLRLYLNIFAMFQRPISPGIFVFPAVGAIMNQFQGPNVGADLFDGVLM